jgi:hypothetical protein
MANKRKSNNDSSSKKEETVSPVLSDDSDDEQENTGRMNKNAPKKAKKTKWSGVFLLALFAIPTVVGLWLGLMDYVFPEVCI